MIKATDEMVKVFWGALPSEVQDGHSQEDAGAWLEAVLEIAKRQRLTELREIRRKIGDIPNGSGWDTRAAALTILFNAEAIR